MSKKYFLKRTFAQALKIGLQDEQEQGDIQEEDFGEGKYSSNFIEHSHVIRVLHRDRGAL